jgi:hypothetical protein
MKAYYDDDLPIKLPNGTYLKPSSWLESYPPIPEGLKEVFQFPWSPSVNAELDQT